MLENSTLVFFSTGYPYETTLKREFQILSEHFDKIYYFPAGLNEGYREPLPDNVSLETLLADTAEKWKKLRFVQWLTVFKLYVSAMFLKGNFIYYLRGMKTYVSIAARNALWASVLEEFIRANKLEKALFYDYWFENATLCLALLKRKRIIQRAISRSHRFDLYDESWPHGKVPFRAFKVKHLDAVFTVARHGQKYFINQIQDSFKDKIKLSYLGVEIPEQKNPLANEGSEKIIVSASNTREFKRVHLIPDVLKNIDVPVRWFHFGTGPCDEIIAEKIRTLPKNIKAEMKGYVPNEQVLEFYSKHHVDLFISLSTSEGLPISMMEAISFGIPVFACNVCGIPDLVNDETGGVFETTDDLFLISKKLNNVLNKEFFKEKIQNFAIDRFEYSKNYTEFILTIKSLYDH